VVSLTQSHDINILASIEVLTDGAPHDAEDTLLDSSFVLVINRRALLGPENTFLESDAELNTFSLAVPTKLAINALGSEIPNIVIFTIAP
jgi:hypothetical protein